MKIRMTAFALLTASVAIAAIFVLPSLAKAIVAGGTENYSFPRCEELTVNITGAQLGEWSASPNCSEDMPGYFSCYCEDGWTLSLTPAQNSVGSFPLTITSYYQGSEPLVQTFLLGSGGAWVPTECKQVGYVCDQFQQCCPGLACKEGTCIKATTGNNPPGQPTSTTTTTIIPSAPIGTAGADASNQSSAGNTIVNGPSTLVGPVTGLATFVASPLGLPIIVILTSLLILLLIFFILRRRKGKNEQHTAEGTTSEGVNPLDTPAVFPPEPPQDQPPDQQPQRPEGEPDQFPG